MNFSRGITLLICWVGLREIWLNANSQNRRYWKGKMNCQETSACSLDNYIELVKLSNLRETNPDKAKAHLTKAFQ